MPFQRRVGAGPHHGLDLGFDYRWRARTVKDGGMKSEWAGCGILMEDPEIDVTTRENFPPDEPAGMGQFQRGAAVSPGRRIFSGDPVVFQGVVEDPNLGSVTLEIEVRRVGLRSCTGRRPSARR